MHVCQAWQDQLEVGVVLDSSTRDLPHHINLVACLGTEDQATGTGTMSSQGAAGSKEAVRFTMGGDGSAVSSPAGRYAYRLSFGTERDRGVYGGQRTSRLTTARARAVQTPLAPFKTKHPDEDTLPHRGSWKAGGLISRGIVWFLDPEIESL